MALVGVSFVSNRESTAMVVLLFGQMVAGLEEPGHAGPCRAMHASHKIDQFY